MSRRAKRIVSKGIARQCTGERYTYKGGGEILGHGSYSAEIKQLALSLLCLLSGGAENGLGKGLGVRSGR